MTTFTHFENGLFVGEATFRAPEFSAGTVKNIFDNGKVVVSLSKLQLLDALQNDEILNNRSIKKLRKTLESIIYRGEMDVEYFLYQVRPVFTAEYRLIIKQR
jgi:hypothetical protein